MTTFTDQQKGQLGIELKEQAESSQKTAVYNQGWDIAFTVGASLARTLRLYKNPKTGT